MNQGYVNKTWQPWHLSCVSTCLKIGPQNRESCSMHLANYCCTEELCQSFPCLAQKRSDGEKLVLTRLTIHCFPSPFNHQGHRCNMMWQHVAAWKRILMWGCLLPPLQWEQCHPYPRPRAAMFTWSILRSLMDSNCDWEPANQSTFTAQTAKHLSESCPSLGQVPFAVNDSFSLRKSREELVKMLTDITKYHQCLAYPWHVPVNIPSIPRIPSIK